MNYADLINAEAQATAATMNMNEASQGGGFREVVPTSQYLGAMVSYVDMGEHMEEFQGQAKGPFPKIRMEVAIFKTDDSGQLDKNPVIIPERGMFIKRNERSKSYKAFQALNYANDPNFTHFAQAFMRPYVFH